MERKAPSHQNPGNSSECSPTRPIQGISHFRADPASSTGANDSRDSREKVPASKWQVSTKGAAETGDDGRVNINFDTQLIKGLSTIYGPQDGKAEDSPPAYSELPHQQQGQKLWLVKLNIVIQVVGSRGDVQPFIALGHELRKYGHRVRIATHNMFEDFVRNSGSELEFFPIGGNPTELMAYMVKNPGLIPSLKTVRAGEIKKKRMMVREMLEGCWSSCIEPDKLTHEPFVADAIIANPPSFAHVHCAQAMGIPVHLMFTMPWTSTKAFPHPLANLKNADSKEGLANYLSYGIVDWLTWQGLGDVINQWRDTLDLEEVNAFDGPKLAADLKIPFTYCWSPALVPKPRDWPSYVDVCGFFYREPPQYAPPPELQAFIKGGSMPVYIGFGSIVLEDPQRITAAIVEAVECMGFRAIVSKGWSKLGGNSKSHKDVIFIDDCPHEWLFQHVAAVVHHGGAGTTACGLKNGRPTTIVPFFGDQTFWGQMVALAGAGPLPIPQREFTTESLSEAVKYCLSDEAAHAAADIARRMASEVGIEAAANSFHRNLPTQMSCDVIPGLPASFTFTKGKANLNLSSLAAEAVVSEDPKNTKRLKIRQTKPISIEVQRWDPISGGASAVLGTAADLTGAVTGIFMKPYTEYRDDRDRRAYEDSEAERLQAANRDNDPRSESASIISTASSSKPKRKPVSAGNLAAASGKSFAMFAPKALKGMTADIPLAMTEGLKNIPSLYGETPRDHGPVTGFTSGATVAGKTFAYGFMDGLSDIVVKPYQGAQKEGVKGAAKGVGKGMVSLTTKTGAGMFGLFGYTSAGIAKSLRKAVYTTTRKSIAEARHKEGRWLLESSPSGSNETAEIMARFEGLLKRNQKG